MELDGRNAGSLHRTGIYVGVDIRLHDAPFYLFLQIRCEGKERGGLPASRGGHEVDERYSLLPKFLSEHRGIRVVVFQDAFLQFHDLHFLKTHE